MKDSLLTARRRRLADRVVRTLPPDLDKEELSAHVAHMPLHYWASASHESVLNHLRIIHEFFRRLTCGENRGTSPVMGWRHDPKGGFSRVIVCTWDRYGLFVKVAGALAMNKINILHAKIFTRQDHVVLDEFRICTLRGRPVTDPRKQARVTAVLRRSLASAEGIPFAPMIRRLAVPHSLRATNPSALPTTWISFNNRASRHVTVLRVQTLDYLGVLFDIASVLTHLGLNITQARVDTHFTRTSRFEVADEFHITERGDGKVRSPDRLESIRTALLKKLRSTQVRVTPVAALLRVGPFASAASRKR